MNPRNFLPMVMIFLGIFYMAIATISYSETKSILDLLFYYFQIFYLVIGFKFAIGKYKELRFNEKLHELEYKTIMEFGKVRGKNG